MQPTLGLGDVRKSAEAARFSDFEIAKSSRFIFANIESRSMCLYYR
ncbi:hypothetical protein [Polaromonas sp. CG9_12]|nr:hypothetical protein [Polaromonas sp. CG9_12]